MNEYHNFLSYLSFFKVFSVIENFRVEYLRYVSRLEKHFKPDPQYNLTYLLSYYHVIFCIVLELSQKSV